MTNVVRGVEKMNKIPQIDCYYNKGDSIRSLEICNSESNYLGEMFFMCDNKHVLKFFRNPNGTLDKDSLSDYFDSFSQKYPLFFKESPNEVFIHFEYVRNFLVTEYFYGAAYSIRTLAERIIYENHGVYLFSSKPKVSNHSDRNEIEEVSNKINKISFGILLTLLMSADSRKEVLDSSEACRNPKLSGEGLKYAKIACKKINTNTTDSIFMEKAKIQFLQDSYNKTSAALHGRIPMDSSKASENLENVLKVYQAYFEKGNDWRTIYD